MLVFSCKLHVGGKDNTETEFSKLLTLEKQILRIIFTPKVSKKDFLELEMCGQSVIWFIQIKNCMWVYMYTHVCTYTNTKL